MTKKPSVKTLVLSSFLLLPSFCFSAIPSVSYMDQVMNRRKKLIAQKCEKPRQVKGFMMIELKVLPKGETRVRLISTDLKHKAFLNCALNLLSRTQFKAFSQTPLSRIYRFFIL